MSTLDPGVQPDHQDAVAAGDQGDAAGGWRGQVRGGGSNITHKYCKPHSTVGDEEVIVDLSYMSIFSDTVHISDLDF